MGEGAIHHVQLDRPSEACCDSTTVPGEIEGLSQGDACAPWLGPHAHRHSPCAPAPAAAGASPVRACARSSWLGPNQPEGVSGRR